MHTHTGGGGIKASLVVVRNAGTLSAKPSSVNPWCVSKTIPSLSLPEASWYDGTTTVSCYVLAAHNMSFRPRAAVAVQPAAALKTWVRIPQGEYEEEMRLPSASGTGDRGHGCRCVVPGALLFAMCVPVTSAGLKRVVGGVSPSSQKERVHRTSTAWLVPFGTLGKPQVHSSGARCSN